MILQGLKVQNLRNIHEAELIPDPQLTVIAGQNGQGKTNLLECVWLLTGSKSFRGAKDIELVREGEDFGRLWGDATAHGREKHIELLIAGPDTGKRGRTAKVNGVEYGRATTIAGIFTAVVFDPNHLSLIKGGPEGRRRFIDAALCQLYPNYIVTLRRFTRGLSQKNALLKKYWQTPQADDLLDAFDSEIIIAGGEITRKRAEYINILGPESERIYAELSNGAEKLQVDFIPCCEEGGLADLLQSCRSTDIRAGFCTAGPHREDIATVLDNRVAKNFGSQGQQRSIVLSLKLAEAATASLVTGAHPVMLLDDVLSELDDSRQSYLLSRMQGRQCLVTTCDAAAFAKTAGKVVHVKNGRLV